MNTNKLELPNKDILNLLNLNKVQMSEMKRFFKEENERPGGPKEGSFEEIMCDILNPASYSIDGYEVGSIVENVTSVEIKDHEWKNCNGNIKKCKKIVRFYPKDSEEKRKEVAKVKVVIANGNIRNAIHTLSYY